MKKSQILIAIVLLLMLSMFLYSKARNPTDPKKSITIAALLNLSGDAAAWGENAKRAIELAVNEYNEKITDSDKKVTILYEDTGGDPKKAVSAFQLVVAKNVDAVIGPLNQTEDMAVAPIIKETKTPTIIPGYIPMQNRQSNTNNPLLVWMDAENEAERIAEYVFSQGFKKVGVIGTLDSWENTVSNAFVKKFKELGGEITDFEIVQPDSADMKLPVTKIISSKPEAIFLGTYYQFINSSKAINDQKYLGRLFSIEVDDYLASQTSKWTDKLQFIAPDYYRDDFVNKFKNKYGAAPGLPSGQAYDATNIILSILQKANDRDEVLSLMKNFTKWEGVSGTFQIQSDGRTILPMALFEVNGGKVSRISEL